MNALLCVIFCSHIFYIMHILTANCHWIYYADFSGLFNISPEDNLSDFTRTHGLDCYLVDVYRLLYKKYTPCSYFNFFFHIPRSVFFNAKEVSCRAENHKSFFVGFVCRVDFVNIRTGSSRLILNKRKMRDLKQEKDAIESV